MATKSTREATSNGNRYFFHGNDYETNDLSIWEIELNMERIVQVDLTPDQVKNNKLERLADYEKVQINCQ